MRQKKVLFLITKSNFGGAQRYVRDLSIALSETHETVVALGGNGPLIEMLKEANIRTISIDGLERDISFKNELRAFKSISRILREERPDILHTNSSKAGILGNLLGRIHRVPRIIFTGHGWAFNEDRSALAKICIKFFHWLTILLSHKTIAVSQKTRDQMHWPFARKRMCVVYNGLQKPDFLSKTDAREEIAKKIPALRPYMHETWTGTIAELHPTKRHDLAIHAMHSITRNQPHVRHIIISDGELREQLGELVTTLGLEEHIFLCGHIPEAARLLRALDIFMLTSRSEALAYTVLEARYAELPVVVSNVGGLPEIVTHKKNGLIFQSGDVDSLTAALQELLENDAERLAYAKRAGEELHRFTIEKMCKETIRVYQM